MAPSLLERLKPYTIWLVVGVVVIAVGLGAWGVNASMQAGRDEKAATALAQVTPKADLNAPDRPPPPTWKNLSTNIRHPGGPGSAAHAGQSALQAGAVQRGRQGL